MDKTPISVEGFNKLRARLKTLKEVERPAVLAAVQRAREYGDLRENADYSAAKDRQREIDGEIRRIEGVMNNANVVDVALLSGERVMFGARVAVEDEDGNRACYEILSESESDMSKGVISFASPLARGMIGKRKGERCMIRTPAGEKELVIIDVKYGRHDLS